MSDAVSTDGGKPVLRIVNADATPEEVAAVVAVFSALGSSSAAATPRRTPEWSAPRRRFRQTFAHGAGGWRSSGLPR
ncbi:acyl-CoA carboxylase epsilon subunit [Nocardioides speluncae]|uniref:acyl-CoA carboxylase epsilon subunit n=1 Tax=Nocardioides speluncae TaxID=2670337 RepID=UPI000D69999B|nr:acyl-CoA carboxylase epsilon subunit [Nocardioides speluncae]